MMQEANSALVDKTYAPIFNDDQLHVPAGAGLVPMTSILSAAAAAAAAAARYESGLDSPDEDVPSLAIDEEETVDHGSSDASGTNRPRRLEDSERMNRRAIANSNERRRMQSINAGFQQLKELVRPGETEKLSKAAILQLAVDFIIKLKREKVRLEGENENLMRKLGVAPPPNLASAAADVILPHRNRYAVAAAAEDEPHHPHFKRLRLDNDSSSYSNSSSSISSDEGATELPPTSLPWAAASALSDRSAIGAAAGGRARPLPQLAGDRPKQSSAASGCETGARRRRRAERDRAESVDAPVADCRPKLVALMSAVGAGDVLTATNGDVRNYGSEPATNRGIAVKQESIESIAESGVGVINRAVLDRLVSASGDAVVPIAADEKPKIRLDDGMFAGSNSDDDLAVGPQMFAVHQVMAARSGCRSPSPGTSSSMSQRNLETILEAIRYLEGDVPCNTISAIGGDMTSVAASAAGDRWRQAFESSPLVRISGFAQMQRC